jgi:DNA replication protein DnaC
MTETTNFDPETADLESLFKRLHLANARRSWKTMCERADAEDWSHRKLLVMLCAEEIAQRQGTRIQREVRNAGFPFLKTIDDYDFTLQSMVKRALLGSYLGPELVTEGRSLVLCGKTGRGKTHLAVAIAYKAIQNGFTARFVTAAQLIDELGNASSKANFRQALIGYTQPHVLVVDEVGYLNYGPDAANVLFHVVNDRHTRKRPMIFTTNKSPIAEWGAVLHDNDLADAIVDRILERGRLLLMDGPSYRTRHLDRPSGERSDQPAKISGTDRPEFPEPAAVHPGRPAGTSSWSRELQGHAAL